MGTESEFFLFLFAGFHNNILTLATYKNTKINAVKLKFCHNSQWGVTQFTIQLTFLFWPHNIFHTLLFQIEQRIVVGGFCPCPLVGHITCLGDQYDGDVFPGSHVEPLV